MLTPLDGSIRTPHSPRTIRLATGEWPILPQSMHLVILHHALEFTKEPHRLLREACQATAPGGRLVIVGFNTRSLWNPIRLLATGKDRILRKAHFYTPSGLTDWLALLGLRTCDLRFGGSALSLLFPCAGTHRPPAHQKRPSRQRYLAERLGLGSFYILSARQ